jgi:hypothetical protein
MASKILALGLDAPAKLIKVKDFKVSGDFSIFPPDFLPDGTTINIIKPEGVGERHGLFWTVGEGKSRSIPGLTWNPQGLNGDVTITCEEPFVSPILANISIAPMVSGNGDLHCWRGTIEVGDPESPSVTPTTGTFVAQTSTDGDDELDCVTHAVRASTDS